MSQVTNFEIPGSPLDMATLAETLEDDFAAVASLNRGTSAPSNPFAGMCWNDTSASPVISIRIYSATYGWVTLATYNDTTGAVLSFGGRTIGGTSAGDILDNNSSQTATNKRLTGPRLNEDVALGSTSTEIDRLCDDATATAAEVSQLHNQGALAADFAKLHAITKSAAQIDSNMPTNAALSSTNSGVETIPFTGEEVAALVVGNVVVGDIILAVGNLQAVKGGTAGHVATNLAGTGTATYQMASASENFIASHPSVGAGATFYLNVTGIFVITGDGSFGLRLWSTSDGSDSTASANTCGIHAVFLRKQ
ncbi:MAG TPA: hypothetical protein DCZ95_03710 [Verrucomicrobia bacterium]|nr:hypothetical protein [Verrucomicrobiota bacterium]